MLYEIEIYETENGKIPFHKWIFDVSDIKVRQLIRMRLERLGLGNFGNCKVLRNGVSELKIDFGPGYRIYFTTTSWNKILVLSGGIKKTQKKDIKKAENYLKDFKIRGKANGTN